ncbi:MAG: hypothetical protein OXC57_14090 [Rhodobacteraceae bacterium]|nr:hypothetical protein [Paracoccaceae bacterium]
MMMQANIDESLKTIVQKRLKLVKVVELESERVKDHDGDPILYIMVVYEAKNDRLDPKKVLGLTRSLRQPLREIDSELYPVFSFLTEEEFKNLESA